MKATLLAAALAFPLAAPGVLSAGGAGETTPAKPKCENGMVYDKQTKSCVDARDSNLDTDALYDNVRELAYAGRYAEAQVVLAQMPQDDDRTLTYLGFTNRKLGHDELAMQFYQQALSVNPANVLARSYMGQGFVSEGRMTDAIAELKAIRAYGGSGTWAEASLRQSIATGRTFNY